MAGETRGEREVWSGDIALSPVPRTGRGGEKFRPSTLEDGRPRQEVPRAPPVRPGEEGAELDEVPERDEEEEVPEERLPGPGRLAVDPDHPEPEQALSRAPSGRGVPQEEEDQGDGLGDPEERGEPLGRPGKEEEGGEDDRRRDDERPSREDEEVDPRRRGTEPPPLRRDGPAAVEEGPRAARVRSGLVPHSPSVARFLRELPGRPKAELHIHLEGSISPATAVLLSGRRPGGGRFPDRAAFRARRRPGSPEAFLAFYRDVCVLLRSPDDYALVASDLSRRLARERIVHAEVYVSPAVVEKIGLPWGPVRDAVERVFARHEAAGRGRISVLLDSVRQWGPAAAERVLDLHEREPWPRAVGFGLGGEEASVPAREFAGLYRRVRRLGLAPLVHAGEWAGPDSVADALRWLAPVRIAHGFRAAEDPALVRRIVRSGVALDLCPGSNAATGAVAAPRHPALELLRAGARLSLSTDDPGLFGTSLWSEFERLARLGATAQELAGVRRAAFAASLPRRAPLHAQVSPPRTRS